MHARCRSVPSSLLELDRGALGVQRGQSGVMSFWGVRSLLVWGLCRSAITNTCATFMEGTLRTVYGWHQAMGLLAVHWAWVVWSVVC